VTGAVSVDISYNPTLVDFRGLDNIANIGNLDVRFNDSLTSVRGLESLTTVAIFTIFANDRLASLRALANLRSATGRSFVVQRNRLLPTCEAEWLRDNIGVANIAGMIYISENDDTGTCPP
jgi:hypothetical protein